MSLEFLHVAHAYGEVQALRDISFAAPEGEITCLLGSSGCGKSTLLGLAAGMLDVQRGRILVAGEVLSEPGLSPPPERRGVGLVFQEGALFPHMTLRRNVGFGVARDGRGGVAQWLDRVGLAGLGERYPHELSGGQRQRAALARAMAPGPRVLLMDEPFASVDIVLRRALRRDCRILLRERGTTTLMVTHDPDEALDIADRIAVMEAGRIVQFGAPADLHERPATASVGAIFSGAQVIAGERREDGFATAFGTWPVSALAARDPVTGNADLLVDSRDLECRVVEGGAGEAGALEGGPGDGARVRDMQTLGRRTRIRLRASGGAEITVLANAPVDPQALYRVVPRPGTVRPFPASQVSASPGGG